MIIFVWDKVIFYGKLLPESSWKSPGWVYLQAWLPEFHSAGYWPRWIPIIMIGPNILASIW